MRLPKSTGGQNPNGIPAASSFANSSESGVVMARSSSDDQGTGMNEPAMESIRARIAQFEGQSSNPPISADDDDDGIDRATTVDSGELDRATIADTADFHNHLSRPDSEIDRKTTQDSLELARGSFSMNSESFQPPKPIQAAKEDVDEVLLYRMESASVSAGVSIASGKSGSTPGRKVFEKMRAPTPDAFDKAMNRLELSEQKAFQNRSGQRGENVGTLPPLPPRFPKVVPKEEWVIETTQNPSMTESCDLTVSTAGRAFESAQNGASNSIKTNVSEEQEGGRVWEMAAEKVKKPLLPVLARGKSHGSSSNSSNHLSVKFEKILAAAPASQNQPQEEGGRLWSRAAEESNMPKVPAVLKAPAHGPKQYLTPEEQSQISEDITHHTAGLPSFEAMRAPSPDHRRSMEPPTKNGHLSESLAESSKPKPVLTPAQRQEWIVEAIHSPSIAAADSNDLTESTLGGGNAFEMSGSARMDNPGTTNHDTPKGGRLWEKAATMYQRPLSPAVASPRYLVDREIERMKKLNTTDGSVSTKGGETFEKVRSRDSVSDKPSQDIDGGRLWELAVKTSKLASVPARAQKEEWAIDAIHRPALEEPCDLTESTYGTNAFDLAISQNSDSQETRSHNSVRGGPLWEKASTTYVKPPLPAVVKSPNRASVVNSQSSVVESVSTAGGPSFERLVSLESDSQATRSHSSVRGGPLWEKASTTYLKPPLPAVVKSPSRVHVVDSQASVVESVSTVGGPSFERFKSQEYDQDTNTNKEFDGGQLWDLAVKTSNSMLAPELVQQEGWVMDAILVPSTTPESCDLTEETNVNLKAFDLAVSALGENQQTTHTESLSGGRLWETCATTYQKPQHPVDSPLRVRQEPDTHSALSDDATLSTIGGSTFDKIRSQTCDTTNMGAAGGPLWATVVQNNIHLSSQDASPHLYAPLKESPENQEHGMTDFAKLSEKQSEVLSKSTTSSHPRSPVIVSEMEVHSRKHSAQQAPDHPSQRLESENAYTPDVFISPDKQTASSSEGRFARALREQTRSRAQLHAKLSGTPSKSVNLMHGGAMDNDMLPGKSNKSKGSLHNSQLAHILAVSCFVTLFGFLGNVFVNVSCYFASASFEAGQYGASFDMQYGLWKYSPPESALIGYPYCVSYDEGNHAGDAPVTARIFHLLSLFTGTFSLGVLWFYAVFGKTSGYVFTMAIWISVLAAIFQLLTFLFYTSGACDKSNCQWGLGSSIVLVTAFSWALLALELWFQSRHVVCNNANDMPKTVKASKMVEMSNMPYSPPRYNN